MLGNEAVSDLIDDASLSVTMVAATAWAHRGRRERRRAPRRGERLRAAPTRSRWRRRLQDVLRSRSHVTRDPTRRCTTARRTTAPSGSCIPPQTSVVVEGRSPTAIRWIARPVANRRPSSSQGELRRRRRPGSSSATARHHGASPRRFPRSHPAGRALQMWGRGPTRSGRPPMASVDG